MKKETFIVIVIAILIALVVRFSSPEDDWLCDDGEWVKHGVPNASKPEEYCVEGEVNNFKECIAAGNPAMESYPRQCRHGDKTYTEVIE